MIKKIIQILLCALMMSFALTGTLMAAEKVKPNYEFSELKEVRSVRNSEVSGWGAWTDQVLLMSGSPGRKYLVILTRPDHDLAFSLNLAVTNSGGQIMAKFDKVYAMNSAIKVGVPIKKIYELKGKEQIELAKKLVEKAEQDAEEANNKSEG
ncbi:DUF6491 family protein [Echinimonas agarilytica]|uniref:DUF6491 family protein n=1 Tax=Echinimonas agarilytica TaxID=1215918 RepID=A0AA41WAV6_9GAMM|nr:DUF6491 family protein [Echinimonas agarilytica]MCM2681328.1 DUF6491 family protein [Echinimonas agarilytica]